MRYSDDDSMKPNPSTRQTKARNVKVASMKAELKRLLAEPLVARGVSTRYITSGSRPIIDDILSGDCECANSFIFLSIQWLLVWFSDCLIDHEGMVGVKKAEAGDDLIAAKKSKKTKKSKVGGVKKEEKEGVEEEWTGFGS